MYDLVVIIALIGVAVVGAGSMWLCYQDGYEAGFADATRDTAIRAMRSLADAEPSFDERVRSGIIGPVEDRDE